VKWDIKVCLLSDFGTWYTWERSQDCLSVEHRPPTNKIYRQPFLLLWPWSWPDDLELDLSIPKMYYMGSRHYSETATHRCDCKLQSRIYEW